MKNTPTHEGPVTVPDWDVALEALVLEEYDHRGQALTLEDFRRLSADHTIRFDDIMVTMFELCIHGQWLYRDQQGRLQDITRETLDLLTALGRMQDRDLKGYTGGWVPFKK